MQIMSLILNPEDLSVNALPLLSLKTAKPLAIVSMLQRRLMPKVTLSTIEAACQLQSTPCYT